MSAAGLAPTAGVGCALHAEQPPRPCLRAAGAACCCHNCLKPLALSPPLTSVAPRYSSAAKTAPLQQSLAGAAGAGDAPSCMHGVPLANRDMPRPRGTAASPALQTKWQQEQRQQHQATEHSSAGHQRLDHHKQHTNCRHTAATGTCTACVIGHVQTSAARAHLVAAARAVQAAPARQRLHQLKASATLLWCLSGWSACTRTCWNSPVTLPACPARDQCVASVGQGVCA